MTPGGRDGTNNMASSPPWSKVVSQCDKCEDEDTRRRATVSLRRKLQAAAIKCKGRSLYSVWCASCSEGFQAIRGRISGRDDSGYVCSLRSRDCPTMRSSVAGSDSEAFPLNSNSNTLISFQSTMFNFQLILDAMDKYTDQTGIDLKESPFAAKINACDTPGAVLLLLQDNLKAFKDYREQNRKFINCLSPVVQFVHSFSGILGEAAGLVSRRRSLQASPQSF
ncbi:hypothetical protein EDB83DRAFT_365343 [Lactarius deliciosus]|nr:hypothetical protein EDB83DRAFT_365343 [Lactarius deliciosus]